MQKELTFIGLGKMGGAMTARLCEKGFTVYGFDTNPEMRDQARKHGVHVFDTLQEAVQASADTHKIVWLMIPARFVEDTLSALAPLLTKGDIIIDGGNSFFKDTIERESLFEAKGIAYVDCGTSGGVDGARNGASLMVGCEKSVFPRVKHVIEALATENGYGYVGEPGAGHFVKMVHNGIEYGMMGAIAEGINILDTHKQGLSLNIKEALKPFEHGSVIESNLISWLSDAYNIEGYLEHIAGKVPVGETEVEMEYLTEHEQVLVLQAALQQRKLTRDNPSFIGALISAMRNQFGGHVVVQKTNHENTDSK